MKPLLATLCVALLSLIGCEKQHQASAKAGGWHSNQDLGITTGHEFGVDFVIAASSGVSCTSSHGNNSSRSEITLADDVTIRLQTIDAGRAVSLTFNDLNYGVLQKGDKVEIGKSRRVFVNGELRPQVQ